MSSATGCRTCAPARPACAASSTPSMPRPPTATPTSSLPMTWKGSSPGCAVRQPPRPWKNAGGCCACWSKTSSSARRRSPSATASRSGNGPAAATTTQPTRRVTCAKIMNCVGGVISPLLLNVAFHGLEEAAGVRYGPDGIRIASAKTRCWLGGRPLGWLRLIWPPGPLIRLLVRVCQKRTAATWCRVSREPSATARTRCVRHAGRAVVPGPPPCPDARQGRLHVLYRPGTGQHCFRAVPG